MNRSVYFFAALLFAGTCAAAIQPKSDDRYLDYVHGLMAEQAGHLQEALSSYQAAAKRDPAAVEVYRDIAQLGLRMNQPTTAIDAAERVAQLAPKDPDSYIFLGNVEMARGDLAKASDAYQKALALDPNNLRALENLGNYYAIIDKDKAFTYYNRYLQLDDNDPEIYFQMGLLHQKNGELQDAEKSFLKASDIDSQQLAPHLALAELYELEKSTAAAIAQYQEAIRIQPHNALLYMRLGRLHYLLKNWDTASSDFQNARALDPSDASIDYWLARTSEERSDWAQAAEQAQKAYELSKDPQFIPLIAYYLTLDHQPKAAIRWLNKARKRDPNNSNVLLFLGMNELDLGKTKKARDFLSRGVASHPDDPQLHFQLGVALDRLGRFPEAEKEFNTVLNLDPQNADAMNYLGYSWTERGIYLDQAERMLRRAVAIDPANGAYLDSLGWLLLKRGNPQEAVDLLKKAATNEPDPMIYDHLGDAAFAAQRFQQAAEAWTKSLAMDPKNSAVKKKLANVNSHVLPTTDQRKTLKFVEGNVRQIKSLVSRAALEADYHAHPVKVDGEFRYDRPDQMTLTLTGTPPAAIHVSSQSVQVEPDAFAARAKPLPLQTLHLIPQFFSGALTTELDNAGVSVSSGTSGLHYASPAGQEAWVDSDRGVMTRFRQPDPASGVDELELGGYQLVEGLWLPTTLRLENPAHHWEARFTFSSWKINGSGDEP